MPLPVSLDAIAEELVSLMDETTVFVNRKTGETATVSQDEIAFVEDEVDEEDLPDWQVEMLPQLREIASGEDWAPLPDKFDVHEWEIMRRFVNTIDDDALSERLSHAIHGKGAFRMFRSTIEDYGYREQWYRFKHDALKEIAREAFEDLGVPYR